MANKNNEERSIKFMQGLSLAGIWVLATSMTLLFINLIHISYQVKDHQTASIAISIVAVVVFWILAGVLTYVFIGLHKHSRKEEQA